MSLSVVILAAGEGTRMFSDQPKVLHKLADQPMLQYVIDIANELNPKNTNVIVGYKAKEVMNTLSHEKVNWILQEKQLGTGDAVKYAIPNLIGQQTLILYGDVPFVKINELKKLIKTGEKGLSILTFNKINPTGYGRIVRGINGVEAIVEEKDCSDAQKEITEVNTGIMVADTKHLINWLSLISNINSQKEYYLTDIVALAKKDSIKINTIEANSEITISGVNSKIELAKMERAIQLKKSNTLMEQGVTLLDPSRTDIRGHLDCGTDVVIDVGCIFEGKVKIGKNVTIGAYSIIKDSEILNDSIVKPYSHLDNAKVGKKNIIGPYARLRPGTETNENVHIGNFVEIKNSKIDTGSKINHLSYVGDSIVGKNVNVGAGTITCNYDGVNKHQTIIEDNVFVGSNTQLVAPVKIRAGSTIGAGSTITKNTPANKLSLSRAKQTSIPSWEKPKKS